LPQLLQKNKALLTFLVYSLSFSSTLSFNYQTPSLSYKEVQKLGGGKSHHFPLSGKLTGMMEIYGK